MEARKTDDAKLRTDIIRTRSAIMAANLTARSLVTGPRLALATDEQLLLQYRDTRDPDAFAILVRRYERELFNYLRRYLRNADQADDVFQATFLQVHRRCHLFDKNRRLRPWLYSIANH